MSKECPTIKELQANTRKFFDKQRLQLRNIRTNDIHPERKENLSTNGIRHCEREKQMTQAERYNFLAFTIILGSVIGVYLFFSDEGFKSIIKNLWSSAFQNMSMDTGLILLALAVVLLVLLFRR